VLANHRVSGLMIRGDFRPSVRQLWGGGGEGKGLREREWDLYFDAQHVPAQAAVRRGLSLHRVVYFACGTGRELGWCMLSQIWHLSNSSF